MSSLPSINDREFDLLKKIVQNTADIGSGGAAVGNATGTIGLSAVNGSAPTALRSDGSPALSQAIVPTWSGLHTFTNGIVGDKTSIGAGVTIANDFRYAGAPAVAAYPFALAGRITLNGSTPVSGGEHGVGIVGEFNDGATNDHYGIGIEGKVNATGTGDTYIGVDGDVSFVGASFTGKTLSAHGITRISITTDGSTPLAQGTAYGYYCPAITGGSQKYAFFGMENIAQAGKNFVALSSDLTKSVQMTHDGTNGAITTSSGNFNMIGTPGGYAVVSGLSGLVGGANGMALGIAGVTEWNLAATQIHASGNVTMALAATVTPPNNSEMMFELTNNTTLTIKVKGTDGTIRSGTVTLS